MWGTLIIIIFVRTMDTISKNYNARLLLTTPALARWQRVDLYVLDRRR